MGSQPTTTELMERNKALAAELADYKEMVDQYRIDHPKVEARAKALEADRDQISLTLAVAKADRDKWFNRSRALEAALRGARDTLREIEPIVKHEYSLNRIRISEKECVAALATSETIAKPERLPMTGAYATSATCKHGVHPYDCAQGCDPHRPCPYCGEDIGNHNWAFPHPLAQSDRAGK